jgi:DNA-binding Xre family transcriptional regulator
MTANQILVRIIEKGGILGQCAKVWSSDKEKVDSFIKECSENCNNRLALELWGEDLVTDIKRYCTAQSYRNKKVNEFNLLIINTIKALRKQKGVKQDVVADSLAMTQSNYSKIEDGLRPLTLDQFYTIATLLNISTSEIIAFSTNKKSSHYVVSKKKNSV